MDIALTLFNLKFLPGVDFVKEPEQVEHVHRPQVELQRHVFHGVPKDLCKSFYQYYQAIIEI